MNRRRELGLVVLACVLAYGTGIGDIAFYTRGEPREGLVVREMLASGEWAVPRRPEGEVARKPPLYYWLAAPLAAVIPDAPELALRLPSAILATAAVLAVFVARAAAAAASALPAALILATTFEWMRAATSARVDMTLAASLTLVLVAWLRILAGGDRRWLAAAAAGASFAVLAKGPVGLAVPALAALAYAAWRRDRGVPRRLGLLPVLGAAALAAGLWYAVAFAEQGRAFLDVVVKENLVRFIDTDDARTGHAHGPLYLPILGLVGLLPWVPLLPLAAPARRGDETLGFAAVWAAVVLVFFSLANAKRSVYLLPAFPALAVLMGAGIAAGGRPLARRLAIAYLPALALLGAAALALAAGLDPGVLLHRWLKPDDARGARALAATALEARPLLIALGAATLAGAVMIERARRAGVWRQLVFIVAALTVGWTAAFDGVIHPAIARTRSLRAFMTTVDQLVPPDASLQTTFPVDPGLRFYATRPLVRLDVDADVPGWTLLWQNEWRVLRDARDEPLAVIAVSDAQQSRRGALALVTRTPGPLHRVTIPDRPDAGPGIRASPRQ